MPEYMDYNDYDYEYKTKRKKIFANIRLVLAFVFIAFVVIWTVTHLPENVRTGFNPVYSSEHSIGEMKDDKENEFVKFNNAFDDGEKVNFDLDFKEKYPKIYALAKTPKLEITKNQVKGFDIGNYFVIATVYEVERQKDTNGNYLDEGKKFITGTTGVDFFMFKYDTDGAFTVNKPERFSIRFYNKANELNPYIEKYYVKSDSFRLNFYSLSVVVKTKNSINELKTELNLENGINKSEYESNFFTKQQFVNSNEGKNLIKTIQNTEGGQRGDTVLKTRISLLADVNYAQVGMEFDDSVYNKFVNFKVAQTNNATYTIRVN